MIERDPISFLSLIAALTVTVYLMRIGGYWLIGRVAIGPRLRRVLDALPGAIVASTVAPILVQGGLRAVVALTAAGLVMIASRNDFAAVLTGIVVAAATFAIGL